MFLSSAPPKNTDQIMIYGPYKRKETPCVSVYISTHDDGFTIELFMKGDLEWYHFLHGLKIFSKMAFVGAGQEVGTKATNEELVGFVTVRVSCETPYCLGLLMFFFLIMVAVKSMSIWYLYSQTNRAVEDGDLDARAENGVCFTVWMQQLWSDMWKNAENLTTPTISSHRYE